MVSGVRVMADIGSDHAYLPICLLKENKIQRAIVTDIARLPLESAKRNIAEAGLSEFCSVRLGAGFSPLRPGEASCIVVAGMGGNLISEILKEGSSIAKSADYLILQAMQHTAQLRTFLNNNHYRIIEERVVFDAAKYYEIIKIANGEQRRFNKIELEIGFAMVKDKVYFDFLDRKSRQIEKIMNARKMSKSDQDLEEYRILLEGIEKKRFEER